MMGLSLPILVMLPVYLFIFAVVVYLIYLLIMALRKAGLLIQVHLIFLPLQNSLGQLQKTY